VNFRRLTYLCVLLCVVMLASAAQAQPALYNVFVKASRVALLPFANHAGEPEASGLLMREVRAELMRKSVDLADSAEVAAVLRKHRIRNTDELTVAQVQALAEELDVAYLIVGSLDDYRQAEKAGEIALSARLLHVPTVTLEWSACATRHTDDRIAPLEIGRQKETRRLVHSTVVDLFHTFRYHRSQSTRPVEGLRLDAAHKTKVSPCRRIMVQPFANESSVDPAGQLVTNQVLTALYRAGYDVVDLGRVRETMLACNDLTQGASSQDMLKKCADDLDADYVFTGTVSDYRINSRSDGLEDPQVSVEARLIETASGNVVWSKNIAAKGSDSDVLFGIGGIHGLSSLSNRLSRKLVAAIPAVHRKHKLNPAEDQQRDTTANAH
jgi:TolB-like protein